jgi:hypothetical protein
MLFQPKALRWETGRGAGTGRGNKNGRKREERGRGRRELAGENMREKNKKIKK